MIIKFQVTGMTCAACSARVEKVTSQVSRVKKAEVNLLAGTMSVEADDAGVIESIIRAVTAAGYGAFVSGSKERKEASSDHNDEMRRMKVRIVASAVFLLILMYFTMGHMIGMPLPAWYHGLENAVTSALVQFLLTLPIVFLNRAYYERGFKALWHRAPNMDSLIAVGSAASLVYGIIALFRMTYAMGHDQWEVVKNYSENLYFESAAMILTLITLGKFLEARAKGKTGDALRQLMDLSPKTAVVRRDGAEITLPVESVQVGDIVIVRTGGSVPADGTVISGRAAIDQSALTGESVPAEKTVGDHVAAATINTEGYLEFRVDKVGEDTALSQVIRMVEAAGGSKAPIARLADKIAGIFVPVVMCIAAATLCTWLMIGKSVEFSLTSAIAVLVISCPCALGLATPVAIMVGTGRGARMNVLFKNAEALENLHRVNTVVLDKTGTLTIGKPKVTDIIPASVSKEELLEIACSIEKRSEHPFAKAIMEIDTLSYPDSDGFEVLPGQGVSATINKIRYYGGNKQLMKDIAVDIPEYPEMESQGKTVLYFAAEHGSYLGAIVAADVLKDDAVDAVAEMQRMGLDVVMLTGDNRRTAEAIAANAGIEHVVSDVLPADKANAVKQLMQEGKHVLMVGDGINDAPALVTADVGMAIGAGTDIAVESADVVLMKNALLGICEAVALSKATIRNIRQNLFWAFFYNCIGIPIAAGVLYPAFGIQLSPMLGAAFMSLSSVFVVTNALRLRFFKTKIQDKANNSCAVCEDVKTINIQEDITMETIIKVEGMMCPHCKARVESVCKAVSGTTDAVVDLQLKQVCVTGNANIDELKNAIVSAGYEVVG